MVPYEVHHRKLINNVAVHELLESVAVIVMYNRLSKIMRRVSIQII